MEETQFTASTVRQSDRISAWEIALAAVVLAACLIGGLALAEMQAPGPAVGVLLFPSQIDFDSASQLVDLIEAARHDPDIAAVVLEVSSPGGYATSSETIFYSLLNFRKHKPLVVVVDGLAASGGYYMAAAGNRIFAPPSSYVGNVGTRGGRPTDPAPAPDELTSGPYKLEGGSRFEQIRQLDLVRNSFLSNVVAQRAHAEMNPLKISAAEIAEARIYLGSEALAIGLIDGEGSRIEGIEAAATLAGLDAYQVVDLPTYLGMDPIGGSTDLIASAQSLLVESPPGTIFMLDTRIPFPDVMWPSGMQLLRKPRTGVDSIWADMRSQPSSMQTSTQATFADRLAPAASQP
jgi:protease IV